MKELDSAGLHCLLQLDSSPRLNLSSSCKVLTHLYVVKPIGHSQSLSYPLGSFDTVVYFLLLETPSSTSGNHTFWELRFTVRPHAWKHWPPHWLLLSLLLSSWHLMLKCPRVWSSAFHSLQLYSKRDVSHSMALYGIQCSWLLYLYLWSLPLPWTHIFGYIFFILFRSLLSINKGQKWYGPNRSRRY